MINDPYQILGVSPNATNDEIKKAYRDLSRKYHPDSYVDNPLSGLAEEKFKEVQEAYKQIMDGRENGYSSGFNGTSTSYSGSADDISKFNSVRTYINARQYQQAANVLSGISNRNAEWHYLYAVISAETGSNMEALNHAQQAVTMDPNNREYTNLLNMLQMRGNRYQTTGGYYGPRQGAGGLGTGNLCCDLWCADTLCECLGGDICSCM